jgi:23S rRNA (adenine2503-C2)-methyltransferase
MKTFTGNNPNVWKYVFEFDGAPTEAVLYRYPTFEERTVLCISVQSGCPVGCKFCGTGNKFIRNLTPDEIVNQVIQVLNDHNLNETGKIDKCKKFQIMFMSMGEPFLNYDNVKKAIIELHQLFPNADLLVSTILPDRQDDLIDFLQLSKNINKIGLQFSVHKSNDYDRDMLIPFKSKIGLHGIRNYGLLWWKHTGRNPYINYCVDGYNCNAMDADRLLKLFSPIAFNFTFSVICDSDETMKERAYKHLDELKEFEQVFIEGGYNTRIFDPAGQDDIGGGCGQLWYVQKKLKEYKENKK